MTPLEQSFREAVRLRHAGRPTSLKIRATRCPAEFVRIPNICGREQQSHRGETLYTLARSGLIAISTRCGRLLTDFDRPDIEQVEEFCDSCLMADTHVVYLFMAADGSPLYVGQSSNLLARLRQHRQKPWWASAATCDVTVVDPFYAGQIEAESIRRLQPQHNVRLQPLGRGHKQPA